MSSSEETTAKIKGEKISEKTSKGQIPPTNVPAKSRTPNTTTKNSTKFPFHLGHNRYLEIQIYNTIPGDPNVDLLDAAGSAVNALGSAFTSYKGPDNFIANAKAVITGATSAPKVAETKTDITTAISKSWDLWKTQSNQLGNPKLPDSFMDTIFLPLPNDIQEKLSYQYGEQGGLTDSLIKNTPIFGGVGEAGINSLTGVSNIISKATGRQALTYNKNKLAKFEGADFRDISLTWTLIPNNQREAVAIQDIIVKLKTYSSPQAVANKLLLRAPFFAKLVFQNDVINEALQFKEVVITGIDVNWTVSGHMETFHDDNPKTISLTVNFKDREPKTQEAWAKGMKGIKVPGASN